MINHLNIIILVSTVGGRDHMHIDITQIGAGKVYLYNMMKLDYKV